MARAIKNRDQHCQFYGCTQTRNLQIHHIIHWVDGGSTSTTNGLCLCKTCHTKVHEGGYRIQNVDNNEERLNAQFAQQQQASDHSLFNFEKELRNDRESFDTIRKLSPTRYRFRIVDSAGHDIRYSSDTDIRTNSNINTNTNSSSDAITSTNNTNTKKLTQADSHEATRVASAESPPGIYGFTKTTPPKRAPWNTAEQPAVYHVNRSVYSAYSH